MRKSPLLPIFLTVAVDVLGLTLILPLLPFYAEHFGASPAVVGLLVASYAICQLVSGPILGQISDHIGRKPMLLVSQLGTFVGFIILAKAHALWMVFLGRIIDGATAGNLSLAQAYISDHTAPENRSKSFAVIGIAFGLGFLIGPAVSGFLSQFGINVPIYAAAGLSLTSVVATATLLPSRGEEPVGTGSSEDPGPGGKRLAIFDWGVYAKFFEQKELSGRLLQFLLFAFTFSLFISGFALFAERRFTYNGIPFGPKQVGYLYGYSGLLGLILQGGLIGRWVKRFGEPALVVSGFACAAIGYFLLGLTYQWQLLLGISIISSYGTGVLRPVLTSLVSQAAGRKNQGMVLGLTQSLNSISQIIAPLVSGFLIGRSFLTAWAFVASSVAVVGFLTAKAHYSATAVSPARA